MKLLNIIILIVSLFTTDIFAQNASRTEQQRKLQLTEYSDHFEIFAEVMPFSINTQSDILAHFTYLDSFKPLERGEITLHLNIDGSVVSQKLLVPTKIGIYKFSMTPIKAGTGTLTFEIKTKDKIEKVVITNITVFNNKREAQLDANNKFIKHSKGIIYYKERSWNVNFSTAKAEIKNGKYIVVPQQAVIKQNGKMYVFLQLHPELFIKQEIEATMKDQNSYIVYKGLQKGERYVNKGVIYLLKNR
ncbi:efflux RND transporter periplasmic adaptor subunit [Bacteroides cellulosilyticus]|jgi:hypothetical protein|uniref:hypothetical protein n=1 Tax=Bacteroides cellulosilyticus TaxID=246787 RepID=UPI00321B146E